KTNSERQSRRQSRPSPRQSSSPWFNRSTRAGVNFVKKFRLTAHACLSGDVLFVELRAPHPRQTEAQTHLPPVSGQHDAEELRGHVRRDNVGVTKYTARAKLVGSN